MSIGSNIKKFRERKDRELKEKGEKGLGVNELARRVGVTGTYISGLERDIKKNPNNELLEKIANELDKKVVDFYKDDDEVILDPKSFPEVLKEEGVEYMVVAKEFIDSGLSVEEIKRILSAVKATKENNK